VYAASIISEIRDDFGVLRFIKGFRTCVRRQMADGHKHGSNTVVSAVFLPRSNARLRATRDNANQGDAEAQFTLGLKYGTAEGGSQDLLKSNDPLSVLHRGRLSCRPQVKSPRQRGSTHEKVN